MFITSSTGEVTAILTRAGRQLLSDNSASFQISGFSFSDDEIDYSLFDGSSDDAPNTDILSFPILEPSSNENGNCSQRFELLTKQFGTLNISEIHVDNISQNQTFNLVLGDRSRTKEIVIRTLRGYDSVYYLSSTNSNILNVDSDVVNGEPDPDVKNLLQKQSIAKTSIKLNKAGNVILTIVGSDTKSITKFNITIIDPPTLSNQPINPPIEPIITPVSPDRLILEQQ